MIIPYASSMRETTNFFSLPEYSMLCHSVTNSIRGAAEKGSFKVTHVFQSAVGKEGQKKLTQELLKKGYEVVWRENDTLQVGWRHWT